ncbi:MAG: hypothetical protein WDO18_13755 [Acidobacteriota bacterium]
MTFAFTGFFQDGIYRVFAFETLPREQGLGKYWVKADLTLVRKHNIQVQELPLLCRAVLESRAEADGQHTVTYSAAEMTLHMNARASAEENRKGRRKPPPPRRVAAVLG